MNWKILISSIALYGVFSTAMGQANRVDLKWEENPTVTIIKDTNYQKESAVYIFDRKRSVYKTDYNGNNTMVQIHHIRVHINDETGIANYNTLKLPFNEYYPIRNLKARTILPSGKVVPVKKKDMEQADIQNNVQVKLIAFEGVEVGCEIEYYYEWTSPFEQFGTEYFHNVFPTLEAYNEIYMPLSYDVDIAPYNNAMIYQDTSVSATQIFYVHMTNLDGIGEKPFLHPLPYIPRIEYRLQNSLMSKDVNLFTWKDQMPKLYDKYLYGSKQDYKTVSNVLKKSDFYDQNSSKAKIFWLENFLKTEFQIDDEFETNEMTMSDFYKNKKGASKDLIKFMAIAFDMEEIPFQLVMTTNRLDKNFDYGFPNYYNLTHAIFYFPSLKSYMAPEYMGYRYPEIPSHFWNNDGLVIKNKGDIQDFYDISFSQFNFPLEDYKLNYHDHDIHVTFDSDMSTTYVDVVQELGGELAVGVRPLFNILESEKKKDIAKDMIKFSPSDNEVTDLRWENESWKSAYLLKPFILKAKVISKTSLEDAGGQYLFKVGELIGKQSQLYDNDVRKYPADMEAAHSLGRTITVDIPQGKTIANLQDLNFDKELKDSKGNLLCYFKSSYTLNGSQLVINIDEAYLTSHYEVSQYNQFRDVINAAADFYKLSLLFE